jgi:hypothetical protein
MTCDDFGLARLRFERAFPDVSPFGPSPRVFLCPVDVGKGGIRLRGIMATVLAGEALPSEVY